MKKVMQAEICDKSGKLYANIELPATFEEMEDCLEKIHSTSEDINVISAKCLIEYDLLAEKELGQALHKNVCFMSMIAPFHSLKKCLMI